jgi:hypothetical protein
MRYIIFLLILFGSLKVNSESITKIEVCFVIENGEPMEFFNYHYLYDKMYKLNGFKTTVTEWSSIRKFEKIEKSIKDDTLILDRYSYIKIKIFRINQIDSLYLPYHFGAGYYNNKKIKIEPSVYDWLFKTISKKAWENKVTYLKIKDQDLRLKKCIHDFDKTYMDFFKKDFKPFDFLDSSFQIGQQCLISGNDDTLNISYYGRDLLKFLQQHLNIRIEIQSYSNGIGEKKENLKITDSIANALKQYLIRKGINENRIEAKGFGNSKPDIAHIDISRNIPKYSVLTERFIRKLPPEEKVIARQRNKRLVVKIIGI